MTFRSRSLTTLVTAAALAVVLAACGSSEDPAATDGPTSPVTPTPTTSASDPAPTPSAEPEGTIIKIALDGSNAAGRRVKVGVGEEVVLRITAAQPGELHVHSSPEQEIAFAAGTSDVTVVIDQPGLVDVEDHASGAVLVQLEVR